MAPIKRFLFFNQIEVKIMLNIDISAMSLVELSKHLEDLERHKADVMRSIEQRKKQEKKVVAQELREYAASKGFSWNELFSDGTAAPKPKNGRGRYKSIPRFRNPQNPEQTWTGRGTRPQWFKDALNNGVTTESMAIANPES